MQDARGPEVPLSALIPVARRIEDSKPRAVGRLKADRHVGGDRLDDDSDVERVLRRRWSRESRALGRPASAKRQPADGRKPDEACRSARRRQRVDHCAQRGGRLAQRLPGVKRHRVAASMLAPVKHQVVAERAAIRERRSQVQPPRALRPPHASERHRPLPRPPHRSVSQPLAATATRFREGRERVDAPRRDRDVRHPRRAVPVRMLRILAAAFEAEDVERRARSSEVGREMRQVRRSHSRHEPRTHGAEQRRALAVVDTCRRQRSERDRRRDRREQHERGEGADHCERLRRAPKARSRALSPRPPIPTRRRRARRRTTLVAPS